MNWRALAVVVVVVSTVTTVGGCTRTVAGSATRVTQHGGLADHGYGYADDRCGLLEDVTIQEVMEAEHLTRPYSGAVCQYILMRQSTLVDLTFSWFETGSLDRERALAQANKAQITDVVVERHQGFIARRSVTGNACSVTAATNPGVASWWVQIRGDASIDPCQKAQALLSKTLSSDL